MQARDARANNVTRSLKLLLGRHAGRDRRRPRDRLHRRGVAPLSNGDETSESDYESTAEKWRTCPGPL
jgi:hypothetical protein